MTETRTTARKPKITLDLGDEHGYWIACLGHVDRYDFMVALAEHQGQDVHVGPLLPPPQHAYMVRFEQDQTDETVVWWQLDAENPAADRIDAVTLLSMGDEADVLTVKRVGPGGEVLA